MSKPELIIVGGANGSGKTTLALKYAAWQSCPYIGADAIAAEISPDAPERAAIAAGKEFIRRLATALKERETVVIESTLAGRTLHETMREARNAGLWVSIAYVFLNSADQCVERVAERVRKGGHSVPEPDIRRRFPRSLTNFWHFYRPLADQWSLMYNSGDEVVDVAIGFPTDMLLQDERLFSLFKRLVETTDG
jgi:predicted ABC-type ATPase